MLQREGPPPHGHEEASQQGVFLEFLLIFEVVEHGAGESPD